MYAYHSKGYFSDEPSCPSVGWLLVVGQSAVCIIFPKLALALALTLASLLSEHLLAVKPPYDPVCLSGGRLVHLS